MYIKQFKKTVHIICRKKLTEENNLEKYLICLLYFYKVHKNFIEIYLIL